jgi:hypothetical protein
MKFLPIVLLISTSLLSGPNYLPNKMLTPGDTLTSNKAIFCKDNYAKSIVYVPLAAKIRVMKVYGYDPNLLNTQYRIDHFIPLYLGGSNAPQNLWPAPLKGKYTVFMKNELQDKLFQLVCSGKMNIKNARFIILNDWTIGYQIYCQGK